MLSCNSMLSRCMLPCGKFERECRRALSGALLFLDCMLPQDCMLSRCCMLPCDGCERECRRELANALLSIARMLPIDCMLPGMLPRKSSLLPVRVIPSDPGPELDEFDVLQAHELRLPALNCRYASRCC